MRVARVYNRVAGGDNSANAQEIHMQYLRTLISLFALAALAQAQQAAGSYKLLKTAKVGGAGGFDYVFADSVGRR